MITLDTRASGQFKVYTEDELGQLQLVAESKNLITDVGMHSVVLKTWSNCFTTVLIGSDDTPPTFGNTAMSALLMSSSIVPTNPASYTIGEYNSTSGATIRLGRTFFVKNTSGSDMSVKEIGTCHNFVPGAGGAPPTYDLFSRTTTFPPFVIKNNKFVYIVYELRLATGVSTTGYNFTAVTDGTPGFVLPANNMGIVNCPFATIDKLGVTINDVFASGHAMFEPLASQTYYLHKQTAASTSTNPTYFTAKRAAFEADVRIATNAAGAASPTFAPWGGSATSNPLILEDVYQNDFRLARHIIVSPTGSTENIHGFLLTNSTAAAASLHQTGIHCMFNTAWVRPTSSFFKLYFEHRWARV